MTKHTTVFGDLLRHLSRSDFYSATSGHNADFRVRVFSCYDLFKAMIYGQVSGCFSVREIEKSMKANKNRLYHAGLKEPIKRSTFCDALEKRPQEIFKDIFNAMVIKAQVLAGKTKKKFKDPLRIIDASVIPLCLKRFDWAKYRKTKGAVKLHLNLDGDNLIPLDACLSDGKVHEVQRMPNLCQEGGVIYAMDRGFVDYKSLYSIELQKSIFVTRAKTNTAYKKIYNNPHGKDGSVLSDVLIELTGLKTKEYYPKPIRKIKYRDKETGKTFEFLTNDMVRDAQEIAEIYKERWEVELFFKWIKQHLKIKSFWGTSMNAVYSQIWVALILTILLWISKTINGFSASAYELLVMIKAALLTKIDLVGLCTNIGLPRPPYISLQPFLEGFKC
ncbi:MAG: IS4 family transposase [Treponema sp.]|jgi:transposase|nr:IS4 family transposase [Treponema sp.]